MAISLLLLLFIMVPAIEIYLLFLIGNQIGGFNTLLVVILTGIAGAALAKSQGLTVLRQIQTDIQNGAIPTDQFIHGLLVFGGGLLLLTPGFLTDLLGLSMLIPVSRSLMTILLKKYLAKIIELRFRTNNSRPDTFEANFTKKTE